MAINRVVNTNTEPKKGFMPVTNMWCPHTMKLKKPMPKMEPIIALYPKMGLREFVAITSELMPSAGNNTMYTSGWPRNQNKCW